MVLNSVLRTYSKTKVKMKFMLVCLLLVCTVAAALGADCVVKGVSLNKGDKYYPPGKCMVMRCTGPNSMSGLGCPLSQPSGPECILIPEDKSKPYPSCCERWQC